jgi:hypothetical protein
MLPDYLIMNKEKIVANQTGFKIGAGYKKIESPALKEIRNRFRNEPLDRNTIITLFANGQSVQGMLAALVWGGVKTQHLKMALDMGEDHLKMVGEHIHQSIGNDIKALFNELNKNNGHFRTPGIGPSFFTKWLFFIGQVKDGLEIKPLIYDKWTMIAHMALLYEVDKEKADTIYKPYRPKSENVKHNTKDLGENYLEFIKDFDLWARELGVETEILEEFVFGRARRGKKSLQNNPRIDFLRILDKK